MDQFDRRIHHEYYSSKCIIIMIIHLQVMRIKIREKNMLMSLLCIGNMGRTDMLYWVRYSLRV